MHELCVCRYFKILFFVFILISCSIETFSQQHHEDFESGLTQPPWIKDGHNPSLSKDYSLSGETAFKAYLPAQVYQSGGGNNARCEIRWTGGGTGTPNQHPNLSTWGIKLAIFFPEDFQPDNTSAESLFQFHSTRDKGDTYSSPPFTTRLSGNSISVINRWISKKIASNADRHVDEWQLSQKIVPGKWHYFVVDIHWDYRENGNGFLRVYMNVGAPAKKSDLVVNYKGPTGYNDEVGSYFKMGIYKWAWAVQKNVDRSKQAGINYRLRYYDDYEIKEGGFFTGDINQEPNVDAGNNQTLTLPADSVTISGAASDPDGSIISYQWTQMSGPSNPKIYGDDTSIMEAHGLMEGSYEFRLEVHDNDGASAYDDVFISIEPVDIQEPNKIPIVDAGPNQTFTLPIEDLTLTGTGFDEDGFIASYQWSQLSGPNEAIFANEDSSTVMINGLIKGSYNLRLTVTDDQGAEAYDEITVITEALNQAPIVDAGPNQSLTLPVNRLTLKGSATDIDGVIKSYQWTQQSGPSNANINVSDKDTVEVSDLTSGSYSFRLTVIDNEGAVAFDEVSVSVEIAPNQVPIVDAGSNQTITLPTSTVSIAGTASDQDGDIGSYQWSQQSGPNSATLTDADKTSMEASNLIEGTYRFRLTVTDNEGAEAHDEVDVNVVTTPNHAPIADAGPNQTITLPTNQLTLEGAGSDADGIISSYQWTQQSGPGTATLNGDHQATVEVGDMIEGYYSFRLMVTDDKGATAYDEVSVIVEPDSSVQSDPNQTPIADAGPNQILSLPTNQLTLNGSASDSDGVISSYQWTQLTGPGNATLNGDDQASIEISNLVEGFYTFRLTVTDNEGAIGYDEVSITVEPIPNQAPNADAGPNQAITLPTNQLSISGVASDSDGHIGSYQWEQESGPNSANLRNDNLATMEISGLIEGSYSFRLTVTDDKGATDHDVVSVLVRPAPQQAPNANAGPNQTLTLPIDKITLHGSGHDTDGTIDFYQWAQQSGPNTAIITNNDKASVRVSGLIEGTYSFGLTVTDNSGLSDVDEVTIEVKNAPLTVTAIITDVTCGSSNGAINLELSGGKGPFSFSWSNGDDQQDITDIQPGDYEITITDQNGAVLTKSYTVKSKHADLILQANITQASCNKSDGAIKVSVSGGNAPYSFVWSTGAKSSSIRNVAPGKYQVTVTDKNGCSKVVNIDVTVKPAETDIDLVSDVNDASCVGNDGSIALEVEGSNGPYKYNWSNGLSGPVISGLLAGRYQVRVSDKHGCFMDKEFTINQSFVTAPVIIQSGDSLYIDKSVEHIQWYRDGIVLEGATEYSLKIQDIGSYMVQVSNGNCSSISEPHDIQEVPQSANTDFIFQKVDVYPNPVIDNLTVQISLSQAHETSIIIYNSQGGIMSTYELGSIYSETADLNVENYPKGIYYIKIISGPEVITRRFIKH